MEERRESALATWRAPQCPFTVQYSRRTLGELRTAVMDAFFSLPHGGLEIGGVLLGACHEELLSITDWAPIACEHAFGPSFTLSDRDHNLLGEMLQQLRRNPPGAQPVGWCHSHHRSGIELSDSDRQIHRRYFPHPWETALVIRPYPMEPAKGVFFFPSAAGATDSDAVQAEFELEAMGTLPPPKNAQLAPDGAAGRRAPLHAIPARLVPAYGPHGASDAPTPVPRFLETQPAQPRPKWLRVAVPVALCAAAAGGAYATRTQWWTPLMEFSRPKPSAPDVHLGLNTIDLAGQLQIRWDREAPAVAAATAALLEIGEEGSTGRVQVELDAMHLKTGVFTYARHSDRVDITMTVRQVDGRIVSEATTFLGSLPPGIAPEEPQTAPGGPDMPSEGPDATSEPFR